jgi:hypothetical protein
MRLIWTLSAIFLATAVASAQETNRPAVKLAQRVCAQVIHCGIKNGQPKEYPTRCAAQDDGATNIEPKTGPTCPALK